MKKFLLTVLAGAALFSPAWSAAEISQSEPGQRMPKLELNMTKGSSKFQAPKSLNGAKEILKAKPDLYSGRVIDAAMISNNAWKDLDMFSVPYGLYKMDMGTGRATAVKTDPLAYSFYAGGYSDNEFIGVRVMSMMGIFNGLNFISINPETKQENWNVQYGPDEAYYDALPCVIAYNPVDRHFYSLNYNEDMTGLTLCKFNDKSRKFDSYGIWQARFQPVTMAYTPKGVCYVIGGDGVLYTVDMKKGTVKEVGSTGVSPSLYVQAMSYDGVTGNFIWTAETNRGARVYAVDPETAETEEISMLSDNQQFVAVHLPENSAYYGAPAQVSSINFNAYSGALEGNVAFMLPNTTFGGAAMSGDVKYTVWIDGEPLAENVKGTAGQSVSIPATVTEGEHIFSVIVSNNIGDSPVKASTYWAGFDYPVAPATVDFSVDADGQNFNAAWSSVYDGQHKGYVHWQLTYNVYLMPGNVKVGDNVSGTSLKFPIPSEMRRYYVEVAAVNSDGKEGARKASAEILQGKAASVPFFEGFDDDSFLNLWKLFDNSGQDRKWRIGSGEIDGDTFGSGNDLWAVTPPISLEASNKYQAVINMRTAWAGYPERLKVMLGKEGMQPSDFIELADMQDLEITDDFIDVPVDFMVSEDGDYEIALVVCSKDGGSVVRISSFAVELIGNIGAPEAVTDIIVIPDSDDALEAEVRFTAPAKTLSEETLASISQVDLLVDGTQKLTIKDVTPGSEVSCKVTDIAGVGKHTFTLVPYNQAGVGKKASAMQFIGCYTAPYSESFADASSIEYWTADYNFDTAGLFQMPMHHNQYNSALEVAWSAKAPDEKTWAFSPDFKLGEESVYTLTFDFQNQHYGEGSTYTVNMGRGANPEAQTLLQDLPMASYYKYSPVTVEVVTSEAGKYNFGFYSYSTQQYDYPSYQIRNMGLTYITSAKAPYSITDFKGVADVTGKLEADLTFKAPLVDFAKRTLNSLDKIEILRGTNVAYTFENPAPGAELTWHDANANYGKNSYTVVAYNSEGRGKVYEVDLFVGEDVPAVENVTLVGNADNMSATLSWDRAEFGVNGGVLMDSDMKYQVFEYDPEHETLHAIATVTDTYYNLPAITSKPQAFYYYGVMPVNEVSAGSPVILSVQLGELYQLPFADSFPNGLPQTGLWSIYSTNPYICWQPTNYFWDGFSAQDEDAGSLIFFNGNGYANYAGDRLFSPKFAAAEGGDAQLTFHVLHARVAGSENYPYPALMRIGVSIDDGEFEIITKDEDFEFDGSDQNWKEFTIDLTPYIGNNHMRICFDGYTNGGYEALYLDNISINGKSSGIDFVGNDTNNPVVKGGRGLISIMNAAGRNVEVFDMAGLRVGKYAGADMMRLDATQGVYVVKIGDKVFKVHVR